MAIAIAAVTSIATATDGVEYTYPSADYEKDSLILVTVVNSKGTSPDAATLAGLSGATWESVDLVTYAAPVVTRHQVWRTMIASSQTAVLTASFADTQTSFVSIVDIVTGCATSGSNGSGAIAQSTWYSTQAISYTITLPTTPTQAVYGSYAKQLNTNFGTPSSFTETADLGQGTPARRAMACYSLTATNTWTSTQPAVAIGSVIGMEFVLQTSGGGGFIFPTRRLLSGVGI